MSWGMVGYGSLGDQACNGRKGDSAKFAKSVTKSEQKVAGDQPSGTTREAGPRSALVTTANSDAAYGLFGFRNKNQLATIIYKSVT